MTVRACWLGSSACFVIALLGLPAIEPWHHEALAQSFVDDRGSLRDVTPIRVYVQVADDGSRSVADEGRLRTAIELRLRRNGIDVVEQSIYTLYGQVVVVDLEPLRNAGVVVYALQLELRQPAELLNDSMILEAVTWHRSYTGYAGAARYSTVLDRMADLVDDFANAYLAVNSR